MRATMVSLSMLRMSFGHHPRVLVAIGDNHVVRELELLVSPSDFWRREKGLRLKQSPMASNLVNHDYVLKSA